MPITADKVRELAARGEGTALDFKRDDYPWTMKASNAELAKDLMALANSLGPNDGPAYILIGVDNDGAIVGIKTQHLDDGDLHTKIRGMLNHTPPFKYGAVEVDGMSVGVYEVRGGGRPFFPLKDSSPLWRHVPLFRDGTSTDRASPTMITDWARKDDPDAHRQRGLELRKLEAESKVHGRIDVVTIVVDSRTLAMTVKLEITNDGLNAFEVDYLKWRIEWTQRLFEHLAEVTTEVVSADAIKWPDGYEPPSGSDLLPEVARVRPGHNYFCECVLSYEPVQESLKRAGFPSAAFRWPMANYVVEMPVEGDLGGRSVLRKTIDPNTSAKR